VTAGLAPRSMAGESEHVIAALAVSEIDRVEGLWREMVTYHERVVRGAWPVRTPAEAWDRRRIQYAKWVGEGGWLLAAVRATEPSGPPEGYAMVTVQPPGATWDLGDRVGELESLAVAERARGTGVGTMLIGAARERLRAEGVGYWSVGVVEANTAAVRLYEREGFRPYYRQLLGAVDG
jgi:ribosomal protein S18 acetylase RimI-like enzyme